MIVNNLAKARTSLTAGLLGLAALLGAGPETPIALTVHSVLPSQTGIAPANPDDPHFVVAPWAAVPQRNLLFVMLPGTGATPRVYRLIVQEAAKHGLHGIGLAYPTAVAVGIACGQSSDPKCFGDVRRRAITGAVVPRLRALLGYLAKTYPGEGWGEYLSADGQPAWNRIVVAGHSQGSGNAGYMTRLYPLARACFFSFGYDRNAQIALPAWIDDPAVTPASRMFAFINVNDEIVKPSIAEQEWKIMGLYTFGNPASVDGAAPPFGGSHVLTTALPPAPTTPKTSRYPNHSEPIADVATPKNPDGTPLYAPVWDTMCFSR